jgi:hypothetical protein
MSTVVISPVVVVDTSSSNPQIVEQSAGAVGVATSVVVV